MLSGGTGGHASLPPSNLMHIRFLVAIASPEWGYGPGQEAEFPDEQASAFIESGLAEAVQSVEPSPEPSPSDPAPVKAAPKKGK